MAERVSATRKQSADPGATLDRGGMEAFSWVKLPEPPRQVSFVVRPPRENAGCRAETTDHTEEYCHGNIGRWCEPHRAADGGHGEVYPLLSGGIRCHSRARR